MRKLILGQWLSLDGYAADRNGTTKFFEDPKFGGESDRDMLDFMKTIDTIVLGRKTYELFEGFWPDMTNDQEIMAESINRLPKIVFSKTLGQAPWGKWDPAVVNDGDAVAEVRKLKSRHGKDIVVWGSISLARALIAAGLVDEFHIRIVPVILGQGRPMFDESSASELHLVNTKRYDSGAAFLKYKSVKN